MPCADGPRPGPRGAAVSHATGRERIFLADRDRDRARLIVGYAPAAPFSLQARLDVNSDDYPHSPYGVIDAESWSLGLDFAYMLDEDFTAATGDGIEPGLHQLLNHRARIHAVQRRPEVHFRRREAVHVDVERLHELQHVDANDVYVTHRNLLVRACC
ncbi:MAG: MtrB/PioB family outer membrane beta-barrel protein [Sphingopyxis sp.]|nr:MtrB/PioB family outer membrane beta-barrel protein [Sphingopyxis sp.]